MDKKQALYFDHIAVCVGDKKGDLKRYQALFELLGFKPEWYRERIGDEVTGMETVVMTRGEAKFALMEGINGLDSKGSRVISQVNLYYHKFGIFPQHIALRCRNLKSLIQEWSSIGIRFLTEDENHNPRILIDRDEKEGVILQCFTYPINKSWFFELKQIIKGEEVNLEEFEEFRDENVRGLWTSLDKAIKEGWLFKVNIFGETD